MLQPHSLGSIVLVVVLSISLFACQSDKSTDAYTNSKDQTTAVEQVATNIQKVAPLRAVESITKDDRIVQPAFLRANLPESVFAYVRIPNIWSFGGVAKGNIFDTAVNAQPFFDAVKGVRSGFNENVIPEIDNADVQVLTKLLFQHLTSPVEVMAINEVDAAVPIPNLVISASADFSSTDEIQALLIVLAKNEPKIEITTTMQADGYAELSIANVSTQLQWDQEKSRFFILVGGSLSPNKLADVIKTFLPNIQHQMTEIENTIDSSGQGVFVWANPRKLSSIGSAMGKQLELAPLAMMGVSSMKNIAIGAGTSNGINRLKYIVEMPVTGFRSYLPIITSNLDFNVMGNTKMVAVVGLPSRAGFTSIENTIALVSQPKDMEGYYKFKKEFNKALGFNIEDLFDFFGQDISFVSDEAGSYVAIRLNDAKKFKTTLDKSIETLGLEYEQRTIAGHTYQHLRIPSIYTKYLEEESTKNKSITENKLLTRLFSVSSHVYWEQEGDYLIMSSIPQTLIDRHYIKTKTPVKNWLEKQQRINPDGSLLMASVRNQGTAEKMYRMHLGALNYLADFTGKPIDMFALATPYEAKIPKESSYGFKISSTKTQLAFELNYESNPFEFLLAGNAYAGVAMLGILSAVAVPAYEDFRVRSVLATGIIDAESVKSKLNEFEIEYGRYPNQYEIKDLKLDKEEVGHSVTVIPNTGEIEVKYINSKLSSYRNTLKMLPPKQGESTSWTCQSKVKNKYLPTYCRKR